MFISSVNEFTVIIFPQILYIAYKYTVQNHIKLNAKPGKNSTSVGYLPLNDNMQQD